MYLSHFKRKKNIIIIEPYEIRFISKIRFFLLRFSILYNVLTVKLNCINQ